MTNQNPIHMASVGSVSRKILQNFDDNFNVTVYKTIHGMTAILKTLSNAEYLSTVIKFLAKFASWYVSQSLYIIIIETTKLTDKQALFLDFNEIETRQPAEQNLFKYYRNCSIR